MNVVPFGRTEESTVEATLREAREFQFETVILLGFKDGLIHIRSSGTEDRLRLIGALEEAKDNLLRNAG